MLYDLNKHQNCLFKKLVLYFFKCRDRGNISQGPDFLTLCFLMKASIDLGTETPPAMQANTGVLSGSKMVPYSLNGTFGT